MRSAKDRKGNSYSVEALQNLHDQQETIPDLFCDHQPCGCAVRFVSRYQQNRSNRIEPIDVPAYIGLTSGSEHRSGCRYDALGQITAIVAQSDQDFINALDNGKRELRLLTLHDGLRGASLSGTKPMPASSPLSNASNGTTTTHFIQTEDKLSSYLRTTADLVKLRALCESDAVLAAEITLRLGSKKIPWNQFFFEQERYGDAWQQIKSGSESSHPVALAGVVKSHHSPKPDAKYKSSFLNCKSLYRHTDNPDRLDVFEVSIAHLDGNWLNTFAVDSEIVMFGFLKHVEAIEIQQKNPRYPSRITTFVTHKLTLQPKFKRQIIEVM
ncbi:hypothetical protein [Deefgea salmonis]|uniref:Uncharacterized protein n=1 Tax=Deefgea salmonis TaxID=2875502 RepID=A0ABS8BIL1_9NEIS|nr:hypothetical protein [Deefgea salmonis]MCB5195552.1 hypothetical protein [Deefgea salmonis]